MSKLSKKFSSRYIKSLFRNFLSSSPKIANRLNLYNQALSYKSTEGEEIININDGSGLVFIAKQIPAEILVAENTGCSLYPDGETYKVLSPDSGIVPSNWVKMSYGEKNIIDIDNCAINLIGVHKGVSHFFHFFFDYIIPLLFYLNLGYKNQKISILVRSNYSKVQKETYDAIEKQFTNLKFVFIPKGSFARCANSIYIKHVHTGFYDYQRNKDVPSAINLLRDLLVKKYDIEEEKYEEKELIYISRRKARLRRIINEKSLIKYLTGKGFKIMVLEDLTLKEQIDLFYNAKFVLGAHGAGFTNLIFSSADMQFMEMYPKHFNTGQDFRRISQILELKRYVHQENNEFMWQSFFVNMKQITKAINLILKNETP
ncbi:MAG: hypothetical protein ACJAW3_000778 [Lentimonas sp.]|jgi:hypothetical protein